MQVGLGLALTASASALLLATALRAAARRPLGMSAAGGGGGGDVRFGKFSIPASQVFYESASRLSLALVNLRPIVPGHVLVVPRRVVPRMSDLTDEELVDLWRSVRRIAGVVEARHGASASNVAVQDGPAAGQTVPHVHVHILPRKRADFARNDDVYDALEQFDARPQSALVVPSDVDRVDRTAAEMAAEADELRALFAK
jgi:bis(5'-adenosyl)-triphosphatase